MSIQNDLDIFKACSDETRLRILFLLSERELCVCELVAILDMPQGKISRHLALLKNASLVSDRREGTWIYYSLTAANAGLPKRLRKYLRKDRNRLDIVIEDLNHLDKLAFAGEICVPRPPTILPSHSNH
jgi:ArsR family transcriptional regulator